MNDQNRIEQWFPRLPDHIRESLINNPDQNINGETNVAITKARGIGVPIVGWQNVPESQSAQLASDEQDWIREHGRDHPSA